MTMRSHILNPSFICTHQIPSVCIQLLTLSDLLCLKLKMYGCYWLLNKYNEGNTNNLALSTNQLSRVFFVLQHTLDVANKHSFVPQKHSTCAKKNLLRQTTFQDFLWDKETFCLYTRYIALWLIVTISIMSLFLCSRQRK